MKTRYENMFARLQDAGEGAFVPFITLGDPNPELCLRIVEALVNGGADALEFGLPFSDPLADGPTIQSANIRALNNGITTAGCFELLTTVRALYPELPFGLLVYANLVFAPGLDKFYEQCARAGVDSVLIADVPVEWSTAFTRAASAAGVASIFIAPPNSDEVTLKAVAQQSSGYTYLVSRAGVTGAEKEAGMPVDVLIDGLLRYHAPPPLLGFGISHPEQVRQAISAGAAGAITGSAIVGIIEQMLLTPEKMLTALSDFVVEMKAATRISRRPIT